jgi:hypothetical protein
MLFLEIIECRDCTNVLCLDNYGVSVGVGGD